MNLVKKEVCNIVLRLAKSHNLTIREIGIGKAASYFIIIFIETNDSDDMGDYLITLNDIFLGVIDEDGNVLDTEANILATGYDGAIILGCQTQDEFNRYMLVAASASSKVVYKDGVDLWGSKRIQEVY